VLLLCCCVCCCCVAVCMAGGWVAWLRCCPSLAGGWLLSRLAGCCCVQLASIFWRRQARKRQDSNILYHNCQCESMSIFEFVNILVQFPTTVHSAICCLSGRLHRGVPPPQAPPRRTNQPPTHQHPNLHTTTSTCGSSCDPNPTSSTRRIIINHPRSRLKHSPRRHKPNGRTRELRSW
jgi:hypothetical protein